MFCHKLCNQVGPIEPINAENVFVKIKNNKKVHLLHLTEPKTVIADQPISEGAAQFNAAYNSDTNSNKSEDGIETFTKLFDSKKFTFKKTEDGFFLLEGMSSSQFSIVYKGRIKLDDKQKPNDNFSKPTLFFLHGVGGSSKIWTKQLNYFNSKGYEIIAIDLIGHGLSEISTDKNSYQFLEMALDVLFIFDMFAKSENVIIGHSYGCSFSQYLSQSRKDKISKIILISGGSPHPLDFKSPLLSIPICLIKCLHPFLNCHFYCNAFNECSKLPKGASDAFNISSKVLLYTMKGQIWSAATEDFHRLIKQPVLLIEGENDQFVPIHDALDMIKVLKNGYLVVVKNGSHMMIIENYELINNLIYLFLNDPF